MLLFSLVAVSVYGNNAVGIFINHDTVGIHTEGTYIILKKLGTINNLTLIKLIG